MYKRIILLCFVFLSMHSQAVNSAEMDNDAERTLMIESLLEGSILIGDNEVSYQHVPEIRAVLSTNSNETLQQINSKLNESGAQVVETKGNYVLLRVPLMQAASLRSLGNSINYAVVLNKQNNNFGILTGIQVVVLRDIADTVMVASDYGMKMIKQFPHLRTVFFQVSPGIDLVNLTTELKTDLRIENTYPEILEHLFEPL